MPTGIYPRNERHREIYRKIAIERKLYKNFGDVSGKNNGRWQGGTSAGFIKSECEKARELDICECCMTKNGLIFHHEDKNRMNNKPENIKILCKSCHAKIHDRIKNFKSEVIRDSNYVNMWRNFFN